MEENKCRKKIKISKELDLSIDVNLKRYDELLKKSDFEEVFSSSKIMLKSWLKKVSDDRKHSAVQTIIFQVICSYWKVLNNKSLRNYNLPKLYSSFENYSLDRAVFSVTEVIGKLAAQLDVVRAGFEIGNLYTSLLPESLRAKNGVFYTPPALTNDLIRMAETSGINWESARIADPACGGGAFLAPIAIKILESLTALDEDAQIDHLEANLHGFEIDPFAGWLSQVFVEVVVLDLVSNSSRRLKSLVTICDTLDLELQEKDKFDLIIGNPPYGKVKLTDQKREKFRVSLFGHANLYGVFTHQAFTMCKKGGAVCYLTPTSFLSGEYFKNLREFIRQNSRPLELNLVESRKGVFDDVLQETVLSSYLIGDRSENSQSKVNEILVIDCDKSIVQKLGDIRLPFSFSSPWILPRHFEHVPLINYMGNMTDTLESWGYKVSTGQLVWNRKKDNLTWQKSRENFYPIIWAESISQTGIFEFRATKRNHMPWFRLDRKDDFLLVTTTCVLLQRTTSKEQEKRLIASVLPENFIEQHGGVVVENHLNMILPIAGKPKVPLDVLSCFLNSKTVNNAFRTISGSVAVSAYELEALPLPSPKKLKNLQKLILNKASLDELEKACEKLYT